ncbi:MAG: thiol peroxidase [Deltaproteobacteria bacterium]|nr:thiol peroxidase [Deltaproteobacteria bacterium]
MIRFVVVVSLLAACSKTASAPPAPPERTDLIKRGDQPLTIVGKTLDVGDPMPDVTLSGFKMEPIQLSALRGKLVVLSVVPSIDTKVCEVQSHRVSDALDLLPKGTEVYTVSRDLPFAQSRFHDEAVMRIKMGSDYKGGAFGKAFGLEVKETGLLARSVWVIAPDGKIAYRQIVADQSTEPDYDALIAAAKRAAGA